MIPEGPVYYGQPVNWSHPLNRGRLAWWLPLPWWSGGIRLQDLCGKAHGTLTDGPTWSGRRGRPGALAPELQFDGTNDYVLTSNLDTGSVFTLAFWARNEATSSTIRAVCRSSAANAASLYRWSDGTWAFYTEGSTNNALTSTGATGTAWTHVVGVYDGTTKYLYINGVLHNSFVVTTGASGSAAFRIGGDAFSQMWQGGIGDGRVYNRALSASEVQQLYQLSRRGYPGVLNRLPVWTAFGEDAGGGALATIVFPSFPSTHASWYDRLALGY